MEMSREDDRDWKEYHIYMDLYKHWMDITLRYNAFYYATTGVILGFFFKDANDFPTNLPLPLCRHTHSMQGGD